MKKRSFFLLIGSIIIILKSYGQDTTCYQLKLSLSLIDLPQNYATTNRIPSMQQSLDLSNDFYELSFWGINEIGNKLFNRMGNDKGSKIINSVFKFGLSLGFSKYASELPIPLGVWAHEEYHRSVLGINQISSKNGNWLFNRWDGTVYGISDASLNKLKSENINGLLYSYAAGVQYEVAQNQLTALNDFYKKRTFCKNALILYNAYYVFSYFKFSTSSISDSVKVIAPKYESKNPMERDFAGADLTAWVYDMFNPSIPFNSRDSFPGGDGVNRRIGFSDLSQQAQSYLKEQKSLSLLNFVNPAIFFVNRIKINNRLSFNLFTQYAPTHFGNDIALYTPVKYTKYDLLLIVHKYSNYSSSGYGVGLGLYNYKLSKKWEADVTLNYWNQPESFYDNSKISGGQFSMTSKYDFSKSFSGFLRVTGKTKGWLISNPYLQNNISLQAGLKYNLAK